MSDPSAPSFHVPVLLAEVLELARGASRVVDGTLGDGGHAAALLAAGAQVLGIDQDPDAIGRARARLGEDGIQYLQANVFEPEALARIAEFQPDFVLLDLGVSSPQLDRPERGFTYRPGASLDMRMTGHGPSAADLLNEASEAELRHWWREFADEPQAGRLAREIVRRRAREPFATSDHLVNAIRAVLGPRSGPGDFARIFQGLRIAVNQELERLVTGLEALRERLVPGGTLAVISYHSGEDRVVKHSFREWSRACICPPTNPVCQCRGRPLGTVLTRRAVVPTAEELAANVRARSAKLRAFRRA